MAEELSTKIFRQEAVFVAGAARVWQLPKLHLPQVAFIGKSNVGKSSLVNSICRRKGLAKISNTPGRTQQINFFSLGERLLLVDLPGYGFAKVAQVEKAHWEGLITHYLQNNEHLALVNILIDARRGIKDNDLVVMELIKSIPKHFQIVFTKADKISQHEQFIAENQNLLAKLGYSCNLILTSSKNSLGMSELRFSVVTESKLKRFSIDD